jgi:hypothetical protein
MGGWRGKKSGSWKMKEMHVEMGKSANEKK